MAAKNLASHRNLSCGWEFSPFCLEGYLRTPNWIRQLAFRRSFFRKFPFNVLRISGSRLRPIGCTPRLQSASRIYLRVEWKAEGWKKEGKGKKRWKISSINCFWYRSNFFLIKGTLEGWVRCASPLPTFPAEFVVGAACAPKIGFRAKNWREFVSSTLKLRIVKFLLDTRGELEKKKKIVIKFQGFGKIFYSFYWFFSTNFILYFSFAGFFCYRDIDLVSKIFFLFGSDLKKKKFRAKFATSVNSLFH